MLEYAGVLREFACVCVNMLEFACACVNMLKLLVFAFICWVRLCLSGVYLNMPEFAGRCLDTARSGYPDAGQVGVARMLARSGSTDEVLRVRRDTLTENKGTKYS